LQWQKDNQGELATIAVIDRGDMVFDYLKENTIIPFKMKESTTDHGTSVIAVGREIAKKARVIMLAFDKHNQKQECIDYIKDHAGGIDVINVSYSTNVVTARKYFDQLKDLDIPIICSACNDGKNKISYPARFDYTIAVGADKYYSNAGEELDCLAPTDIYYLNSRGEPTFFTGTSCAAPFVSFALALYITWRKKNGLPRLGREEIRKFIHDNCEDMYEEGHDLRSGYGLFKLPEAMRLIELTIGSNKYKVDGEEREMDTAPFVKDMRTFVPIRFVAEALGKKVSYTTKDGLTDKVYIE
ncbi:MAG TPA: stalk domain-containing protein, partial [Bacillota bacterium]|nr:stalk domain-containing protein [Bacillota bacterium]